MFLLLIFLSQYHCYSELTVELFLSFTVIFSCLLPFIFYHLRCFSSMAFTHGCSAGWLASACAPTSALSAHTASVRMVTRPSCTSCQPVMLAWRSKFSSRTRRVPFSSVLHHCHSPPLPCLLPLQMAPHLRTGGHTPPCPQNCIPAAALVSEGVSMWVW